MNLTTLDLRTLGAETQGVIDTMRRNTTITTLNLRGGIIGDEYVTQLAIIFVDIIGQFELSLVNLDHVLSPLRRAMIL
jgi:hypothetical protein